MVTKETLKQEIEQLDDSYLDLVFRLLQQFPHQKNERNLLDCSRPIGLFDRTKKYKTVNEVFGKLYKLEQQTLSIEDMNTVIKERMRNKFK